MSEHSPGTGQVVILGYLKDDPDYGLPVFKAILGGKDTPHATGPPTDTDVLMGYIKQIIVENCHETFIFPESTANVCTLTAHASPNTWSAWAEIADNQGTPDTLSSKFASVVGHLSGMLVEVTSVAGELYMVEIAYGDPKVVISRHRVLSETNKLPIAQVARERPDIIPAGETVYARVMAETGAATLNVHFRYHLCE